MNDNSYNEVTDVTYYLMTLRLPGGVATLLSKMKPLSPYLRSFLTTLSRHTLGTEKAPPGTSVHCSMSS